MSPLTLSTFGAPLLARDGVPVPVQRRKVMALLVYLAVTGQMSARDHLVDLFWPEEDPDQARADLRRTLSDLARTVGATLTKTGADGVGLTGEGGLWSDVVEFRRCLGRVYAHVHLSRLDCHECSQNLARGVELYKADFLAGFSLKDCPGFDTWECLETENLRREFIAALRQLVEIHQAHGDAPQALHYARRWLSADPTDEAAHRLLIHLYAAQGQPGAARRQYAECARILASELGVSPAPETEKLYRSLCPPLETSRLPDHPKSARRTHPNRATRLNNLPAQATSFIGRRQELEALTRLLAQPETRLVTLTGPGGVGKTRLCLQLGERVWEAFQDGVCFVPLATLSSPDLVAPAIVHRLGLRETGGRPALEKIQDFLRSRRMLLILDNFEHLQPAAALVGELLAAAPGLKIVATSRAPLRVYGEQLFPVAPLLLPRPGLAAARQAPLDFESIQLFVERARQAQPDFTLNAENAPAVVQICRQLDGLPLAIELAATHARWLLPEAIAAQFGGPGGSFPFYLLQNGAHDQPARHQTLQGTIAWSYALLKPVEQAYFRRFGVFAGGAGLEAARAVCAEPHASPSLQAQNEPGGPDDWAVLEALHNQALLAQTGTGGTAHFQMLELIRAFALEQLRTSGEEALARERHAAYYLGFIAAVDGPVNAPEKQAWIQTLAQERDNLRAVLEWALLPDEFGWLETHLRQVLQGLDKMQLSFGEQHRWMVRALARLESVPANGREGIKLRLCADLSNLAATSAYFNGDYPEARLFYEKGQALLQQFDEPAAQVDLRIGYAWTLLALGDEAGARIHAEKVLNFGREARRLKLVAHALNHLGSLAWVNQEYALAERLLTESLHTFQEDHNQIWEGLLYMNLGNTLQDAGRLDESLEYLRKCLLHSRNISSHWSMSLGLEKMARLEAALGFYARAARLFAAAETAFEENGYAFEPLDRPGHETWIAKTRAALGEASFATAREQGLQLPLEQAIAEALGEIV